MPPYRQRSGGSPRARCGSLCAWRGPPAVLSGRRFGSVGCGARRLRGPQRLRALPSPPRHFKWGRGCGAARLGSAACGRRGFGIIFSYDTSGFHVCHLKAVTKKCQFGKNGDCILWRICYNGKSNYCVNAKYSFLLYLNYESLTRLSQKKKEN